MKLSNIAMKPADDGMKPTKHGSAASNAHDVLLHDALSQTQGAMS